MCLHFFIHFCIVQTVLITCLTPIHTITFPQEIPICFSISHSNYTIKPVNNSTAALDYMRKVRTVFCPDFLAQSYINSVFTTSLPVPCKRSSAAPIPFGFRLSAVRSHRFALPVTARSAHAVSCRFVNLGAMLKELVG